jgi:CoA-transferase family III
VDSWVASGLAGLTGRADGPPLRPADDVVTRLDALTGGRLELLGERAALAGLTRRGDVSCGGSSRLVPGADGWLAVTLARPDDVDTVPAWLEAEVSDPWAAIAEHARCRPAADLVERAILLGLPVARVGEHAPGGEPVVARRVASAPPGHGPILVVDLSSLWAGPLCGRLLGAQGARVIKVESTRRPDGARQDPSGLYDLLNHGKEELALDLGDREGVGALADLLRRADVVIESSRPRALQQLGIDAEALLAEVGGPRVWVSITGHGRGQGHRVGFGDDTAAAGGLVAHDGRGPCFLGDAIADPLAGVVAAREVERRLAEGGAWLLDVGLARVAASAA